MAFPALSRPYAFNDFPTLPGNAEPGRDALFEVFTSMITLGSNPWVVAYSSDGMTAGTSGDNINRWLVAANLIWNTSAHSWVVLQNVDGVQVLFDLDFSNSAQHSMNMLFSNSGGFTGGTTTVRPTAPDEENMIRLGTSTSWISGGSFTDYRVWCHASDDGKIFRWNVILNSVMHAYGFIEEMRGAPTGAIRPYYASAGATSTTNDVTSPTTTGGDVDLVLCTAANKPTGAGYLTCQAANGAAPFSTASHNEEWSGETHLFTQGVWVPTSGGARGAKGSRFDAYWTNDPPNVIGTGLEPGNRTLLSYGHWVYPHNNSDVSF